MAGSTDDIEKAELRAQLADVRSAVRAEKLGEVAAEFEAIHNIDRAKEVGSRAHHHPGRGAAALPHQRAGAGDGPGALPTD